jgi:hypothetical protein
VRREFLGSVLILLDRFCFSLLENRRFNQENTSVIKRDTRLNLGNVISKGMSSRPEGEISNLEFSAQEISPFGRNDKAGERTADEVTK